MTGVIGLTRKVCAVVTNRLTGSFHQGSKRYQESCLKQTSKESAQNRMYSPQATLTHLIEWLPTRWHRRTPLCANLWCAVLACCLTWALIVGGSNASAQNYRPRQNNGSLWLKPFQWSNQEQQAYPTSQPASQQAYASDSSSQRLAAVPARSGAKRSNPFAWTNDAEPSYSNTQYASEPSLASRVKRNLPVAKSQLAAANPMKWSNEMTPATNAASLQPPPSSSFSGAIKQSLSWQQDPEAEPDPMLQKSMPPANATDKQLVEWEKEHYPWIRPFYWSEPEFGTPEAMALEPTPEVTPSTPGSRLTPFLARPFQWTNRPSLAESQATVTDGARQVAYLQNGEALPLPPQLAGQAENVPPGKDSEDQLKVGEDGEEDKGAIGQAETLGREPVDNSLQFLRADTVLLKPGQSQWDYGLAYTLFDRTVPVAVATPDGTIIELARFRRRELIVPLELRYGLARRVQLFVNAPLGWSNTEIAFSLAEDFENTGGIGDVVFGGTFLLRQGNHECSDAIMTVAATAPTGQDPFAPIVGLTPSAPALGGGTWSLASTLLFVRNYDPVVLFYGAGTRQHFTREVQGRDFEAGGEYSYQMGVGFAVNDKVTFSSRFNGAFISESRLDGERIKGSIQEPMTVGLALTISRCQRLIEPFVDFGLTTDSTDARFGVVWTR